MVHTAVLVDPSRPRFVKLFAFRQQAMRYLATHPSIPMETVTSKIIFFTDELAKYNHWIMITNENRLGERGEIVRVYVIKPEFMKEDTDNFSDVYIETSPSNAIKIWRRYRQARRKEYRKRIRWIEAHDDTGINVQSLRELARNLYIRRKLIIVPVDILMKPPKD